MADTKFIRTPSGAGNKKKYTFSIWFKRGVVGAAQRFVTQGDASGDPADWIEINGSDLLDYAVLSSSYRVRLKPAMKFVDTNAWYHVVVKSDSEQASSSDREKIYINGNEITVWDTETYGASDQEGEFCSTSPLWIGADNYSGGTNYAQQYLAQVVLVDGQALGPTNFGAIDSDTGEWKPLGDGSIRTNVNAAGTFGTTGFLLPFSNSSNPGYDYQTEDRSGTTNDFTKSGNGFQCQDNPSNSFAVLNTMTYQARQNLTFTNSFTTVSNSASAWNNCFSNMAAKTGKGKYYWEVKVDSWNGSDQYQVGIVDTEWETVFRKTGAEFGAATTGISYESRGYLLAGSSSTVGWGDTYTTGDIIGVALDLVNKKCYFAKNGTWQNSGDPTSGSTGTGAVAVVDDKMYWPAWAAYNSQQGSFNFGNGYFGSTAISSEGTNASGLGKFEYDVPTGYTAWCTKGLNSF